MHFLCRIGIHRWVYRDRRTPGWLVTEARCARRCRKYHDWAIVNEDRA